MSLATQSQAKFKERTLSSMQPSTVDDTLGSSMQPSATVFLPSNLQTQNFGHPHDVASEQRWQMVRRAGWKKKKSDGKILGTKANDIQSITSMERIFDIFVGGASKSVKSEDIKVYCESLGVTVKNIELISNDNSWAHAFKISLSENDRDKLLNGDCWPTGIFVRKFYKPRAPRPNLKNNSSDK